MPVTQPVEPVGPGGPSGGGAPLEYDGGGKLVYDADIYQNFYVDRLGAVRRPGVPYTI
jgi:hypothetical protein